ncbi:MAG TPA: phenylalanine--tRNA ligase subunit beta [Deltaproteobacteria bacterium]|nr:phenylalanine--tRNA ligase subunit beta [Deltaproteobacteria bacterium]HCP45212.1 phenylalanine--tRNA ligase subunit beta [Deltaproteobacteria bacterium]
MRVPLSWLGEMVELSGSPESICEQLTASGLEAEVAEDGRAHWDNVVTARLQSVERHPDADKLTVTRPFDGETEWNVVCGATNHKEGDIVALARAGAVLPGGFKIKKGKFRGVPSEGMLCSEAELGLSEEAAGILILPADTPLGVPVGDVIESGDVVIEIFPTANRGDCLSVLGLARELAAVTGWPLLGRQGEPDEDSADPAAQTLSVARALPAVRAGHVGSGDRKVRVELEATDGCPRYSCAVVNDVKVGPSPTWMQERLEAMGVRAINNVVDCTNYVMLELGNPLHAFDRSALHGGVVTIRWASDAENARTLDGANHTLVGGGDLVIADTDGVIALAGVMGGENSEVEDGTTVLFLESAHFVPDPVRRTAHRCKLTTESSQRFARGVDPELPRAALLRLIELLGSTAGATLDAAPLDLYPEAVSRPEVPLRLSRVAGLLGMDIPEGDVAELLRRCGMEQLEGDGPGRWLFRPPSYRFDIEREVDLLEEVARLHGYDKLPEVVPARELRVAPRQPPGPNLRAVRSALRGQGLSEAIHFSFIDPSWLSDLGLPEDHPWRSHAVTVGNPLSEVGGILRPTLLPSLLRAAARNRAMGAADVRLFELRRTFAMRDEGFEEIVAGRDGRPLDRTPARERTTVAGVLLGRRSPPGWKGEPQSVDFFDLKACVEALEHLLGWQGYEWRPQELPQFLDPREAAVLEGRGRQPRAGWMGRIRAGVLQAFELDTVAYGFELDIEALSPKRAKAPRYTPVSRYPRVERDMAFVVSDEHSASWVLEQAARVAKKGPKDSFQGVTIFDVYRGENIAAGSRSLALRFQFRAPDRTLEDKAVDAVMTQVESKLCGQEGITLRT